LASETNAFKEKCFPDMHDIPPLFLPTRSFANLDLRISVERDLLYCTALPDQIRHISGMGIFGLATFVTWRFFVLGLDFRQG
jgi:hypothetical protein